MNQLKTTKKLQQLKTTAPKTGCYLLKNDRGQIIYIGKAKNLAQRIQTHLFNPANPSAQLLAQQIEDWETILTNNEKEAFILEQNLIKKHLPHYNVILKDDRRYPYIYISSESRNPRYYLMYRRQAIPGLFYGPFPDQYSGKKLLHLLENLFPLKKCRTNIERKPCFYYQIGQCLGGCWKVVTKQEYRNQLKRIQAFFRGKIEPIKRSLKQKIQLASRNFQFEQANRWKKICDNLTNFVEKQIVEFPDYYDRDFVNYFFDEEQLIIQVFFYRNGKLQHQTHFWTKLYNDSLLETVESYLQALYSQNTPPKELISPKELPLTNFLKLHPQIKIIHPKQGKKAQILALIFNNCQNLMKNYTYQIPHSMKKNVALEKLQTMLALPKIETIDFIDLSYWNQKALVIGMISRFQNGWEVKTDNRHYVWKGKGDWNESQFMAAALEAGYQTPDQFPDLLLLDGSFLQMKGAKMLLQRVPTIGLVKNEKHQTKAILNPTTNQKTTINDQTLLNFLRYIQETGHLNAIKKFKQLQSKQLTQWDQKID